jgi:4-amino-4-deoxy-L-arabinose transferase-like glycosyltransferase
MRAVRVLLHSFALLAANLTGVIIGFVTRHALGAKVNYQLPIAIFLSVLFFLVWTLLLRRLPFRKLTLRGISEFALAVGCSLLWNPIVFIPLHYFTQGYLTGAGNIIALMCFQLPVNAITLLVVWAVTQPRNTIDSPKTAPSSKE